MDPRGPLLIAIIATVAIPFAFRWLNIRTLRRVADDTGLRLHTVGAGLLGSLHGNLAGCRVQVSVEPGALFIPETRIVFHDLPTDLRLEPRGVGTLINDLMDGDRLLLGDEGFDQKVWLSGDEARLRGQLSDQARRHVQRALAACPMVIREGQLRVSLKGVTANAAAIAEHIGHMTRVAELLGPEAGAATGGAPRANPISLAARVQQDRVAEVRRMAMAILVDRWPTHSATARALEAALADSVAANRLAAVRLCQDASTGLPSWPALCALLTGPRVPAPVKQEALVAFEQHITSTAGLSAPRPSEVLSRLLALEPALPGAIRLCEKLKHPDLLAPLLALDPGLSSEAALAQIRALHGHWPDAAQPALVARLDHPDVQVQLAAIHALSEVGDVYAVAPLQGALARGRIKGAVKQAAGKAVEAIQGRLGDDAVRAVGGLSFSDPKKAQAAGGLSFDRRGELSEGEPDA